MLRLFGARWRREARLPEAAAAVDTPRPLTPAPFTEAIPDDAPAEGGDGDADAEFRSFAWREPAVPPPPAAAGPPAVVPPDTEPDVGDAPATPPPGPSGSEVAEPEVAEPEVAEPEVAEPEVGEPEASEPARPSAHEDSPGFVTYGRRATEPPVEAEPEPPPPPPVPDEASVVEQAEEWPATVAPKAIPAPAPSAEPVRPEREPSKPRARSGPLILLAAALVVGAGVGWLVAPAPKETAAPAPKLASSASNATLGLRFPDGWRTGAAPRSTGSS